MKTDVNVPSKSNKQKNFLLKLRFCWCLEGQWRKQEWGSGSGTGPDPNPDPDQLVRGRIRGSGSGSSPNCHGTGTLLAVLIMHRWFFLVPKTIAR